MEKFVREAEQGSIPHAKTLAVFGGFDKEKPAPTRDRNKKRGPDREGLLEMLWKELQQGCATDHDDLKQV